MEHSISYLGKSISYSINGIENKRTLVFLHGYLEYKELWSEFTKYFDSNYRILCIDLPGHGASENLSEIHKMKDKAHLVHFVINNNGIKDYVLVGHSMGGYVSLAFLNIFPNETNGMVLFSSSALNDSTEKILARNRDIEMVNNGNKNMLIDNNIPNMFASAKLVKYTKEIEEIKKRAQKMTDKGIIAALNGMKTRVNNANFLKNIDSPVLFIAGKLDNLIQIDVSVRQVKDAENISFKTLNNSGHMGYIEEADLSAEYINNYLKYIFKN